MEPEDLLDPPDVRVRLLSWVITALLVLGFGSCIAEGANTTPDPELVQARISGFGEVGIRVQVAGGSLTPAARCALHPATEKQRQQGLMNVTDFKGYVGMVFRFPAGSQSGFFMKNTPTPLSIAWFGDDGHFVSAADMAPCGDSDTCPVYSAKGPYRYALEVPQGQLASLGIGPGSVLTLNSQCPAT
jgi:uncharacterized membrane protein (UPF0127 family)